MNKPLSRAVNDYAQKNTSRFHTPGHKGKPLIFKGFGDILRHDITELSGTDNLSAPEGVISQSLRLAAETFGAAHTFFSVNGSTLGNLVMLTYASKSGGKIIVDRNCHISVFSALTLTGMTPVYVGGNADKYGICTGVCPNEIEEMLRKNSDAKAVMLTSPNVFGITSDIAAISEVCRRYNALLMVDEAHGAHFAFSPLLPDTAISQGADICVQSLHKTLPAPTQTAVIHISDVSRKEDIQEIINLYQTTSPSYLLMAGMDEARYYMQENGEKRIAEIAKTINNHAPQNLFIAKNKDVLRLVFLCNGYESESILEREGIVCEMAAPSYILCISTAADTPEEIKTLLDAASALPPPTDIKYINPPPLSSAITPAKAFYAQGEFCRIENAAGKILKKAVYSYPPGTLTAAPGEVITKEMTEYIISMQERGVRFLGVKDNKLCVLKNI